MVGEFGSVSVVGAVPNADPLEDCLRVAGEPLVDLWWCVVVCAGVHLVEVNDAAACVPSGLDGPFSLSNTALPPEVEDPVEAALEKELEGGEGNGEVRWE